MDTAHARITIGVGLGSQAPDAELTREAGNAVFLSSHWEEQPLVLVLVNDLKPEPVVDHVITIRDAREEFDEAGGAIVFVTRSTPSEIAAFRSGRNVTLPVLSDPSGEAHAAYGVPSNAPAAFVVDTAGVIRYAHRAATALDTPSTWELIDAVCGLTGEVVERPEPASVSPMPFSLRNESAEPSAFVAGAPVRAVDQANYVCGKCGSSAYEIVKIATSGGWISRLFNFQYRKFVAIVCTTCNHAELYRTKGGTAANIADIIIGA